MGMCMYVEKRADIDALLAGGPVETSYDHAYDLHKAWHIIHFALSQEAWGGVLPSGFLQCGQTVEQLDLGYGPGSGHDPAATKDIAAFLKEHPWSVVVETLWDHSAMQAADVYCTSTDEEDREFAEGYYTDLRTFVMKAAAEGAGLLIYMS